MSDPKETKPRHPTEYKWLVVINREGESNVTGFFHYDDARKFYDLASLQWSDSYLCDIVKGPCL